MLDGVSLRFAAGESCVLLGPSGSGKTTLLSILGCLLSPSCGELRLRGEPVPFRSKGCLARLRRRSIGFVFQQAQLLPFLTIEENIAVVGANAGLDRHTLRRRVSELLEVLGLQELRRKSPLQASGGERQRTAVARALVHQPPQPSAEPVEKSPAADTPQRPTGIQGLGYVEPVSEVRRVAFKVGYQHGSGLG